MVSVVLRSFDGPGARRFEPGDIVDSSGWRLERQLHDQRRLRAATQDEAARVDADAPRRSKR